MASYRLALIDIVDAIETLRGAAENSTLPDYERNRLLQWSCERGVEIISEASRRIPEEVKSANPDLPWRDIASIGNVLRHEYQRVSPRIVWNAIQFDLEPLEAFCRAELAKFGPSS